MATTEHVEHTAGVIPSVNDLVAGGVILLTYAIRVGVVEEGRESPLYLGLYATTDVILPLLAGLWLLAVPTYHLWCRVQRE